jgi:hypothetical protein
VTTAGTHHFRECLFRRRASRGPLLERRGDLVGAEAAYRRAEEPPADHAVAEVARERLRKMGVIK